MKINKTGNVFKLIALIVAIIVLIFVVIITSMMTGENGLLNKAKIARVKQMNQEMQETLVSAINDMKDKKPGGLKLINVTEESLKIYLEEYKYYVENNIEDNSKIITMKKDDTVGVYKIDVNLNIIEITKHDVNILTYKINSYENSKVRITIKIINDIGIKSITYPENSNVIECSRKKQVAIDYEVDLNKEYEFIINAEDGSTESKKICITIAEMLQDKGEIITTPESWTSTNVQVEIRANEAIKDISLLGVKVQYKEGEYEESVWNEYNGIFNLEENKKITARFVDSNNTELYVLQKEINNIDRVNPRGSINVSRTWVGKGKNCTATVNVEDLESGIDFTKCKYIFNKTSTEIGKDITKYTGGTIDKSPVEINASSNIEGVYYFHVLITDNAGNMTEVISEAIEVKNVYEITTAEELQHITDMAGTYYIMNDIDMTGFEFKPINGTFTGTLDGQGHTISNLNISGSSGYEAMFKTIRGATIKNILFKDVNIISTSTNLGCGVIAGEAYDSNNFIKVGITGNLTGYSAGSFCRSSSYRF